MNWRGYFTPQNWTRLGAVFLALVLWANVALRSGYEYTFSVPVSAAGVPERYIMARPLPPAVTFKGEATGRDLLLVLFSDPGVVINCRRLTRGENRVAVKPGDLKLPKGVVFKSLEVLEPQTITVDLDRVLTKKVRVNKNVDVSLREGRVVVGQPSLEPREVTIRGPYKAVRRIRSVSTDSVRLKKVDENLNIDLTLLIDDYNVTADPAIIRYNARIERLAERTIRNIPVVISRVPRNIEAVLDEPFITLTVQGGESLVSSLTRKDISVTLDYHKIAKKPNRKFAATIRVPENIKWVRAEPQRFSLREKIILNRSLGRGKKR